MKALHYILNTHAFAIVLAAFMFFGFAGLASAQTIEVDYGGGPLFSEAEFLPGDAEVKSFTVENLSGTNQEVRLRTVNESDTGLAEAIVITIERTPGALYFDDTLRNLFDQNFVWLGDVADGATVTYTVSATFLPNSGNGYKGGEAGFAFCVGYVGDNENCVTDTATPDNPGGGGGGGGNTFSVFNEEVAETGDPVVITFETNDDGTTYLVCGNLANGSYSLDTGEAFFGYEFEVAEDTSLTKDHEVELESLDQGTYECVPASREDTSDPYTFGDTLTFVVGPDGRVAGDSTSTQQTATIFNSPVTTDFIDFVRGSVLGEMATATTSTSSPQTADEVSGAESGEKENALALADMFGGNKCTFIWLLLLAVISLSWSLIEDKLGKQSGIFSVYFIRNALFSGLYALALLVFHYFGILETFWWIFAGVWVIATAGDYLFHKKAADFWSAKKRNLYFGGAALVCALVGILTPLLCVWMPFLAVTLASAVLFFIDD